MPVVLAVVVFLVGQMATLFGRKGQFIKLSHCDLCHNLIHFTYFYQLCVT